ILLQYMHNSVTVSRYLVVSLLTAWLHFRLCSFSEARVTSSVPYSIVTFCCRSNNLRFLQSRCVRTLPRRAAQKPFDTLAADFRLLSATAIYRPSLLASRPAPRALSSAIPLPSRWSLPEAPRPDPFSAGA